MSEDFLYLLPPLLLHLLTAWFLIWLFALKSGEGGWGRQLLAAGSVCALNVIAEWFLRDLLLEGVLVFQWALFVLIANRLATLPLPRAMVAFFCFFSLMLGAGLLRTAGQAAEESEEAQLLRTGFASEADPDLPRAPSAGALRLRTCLLDERLSAARSRWFAPPPPPPTLAEPPPPVRMPSTPTPVTAATATAAGSMTGEEFAQLFVGKEPEPAVLPETPSAPAPPWTDPATLSSRPANPVPGGQPIGVRNRSTDPAFPPPDFHIGAVSIGSGGRFAWVDGELLREGTILRVPGEGVRGWRLYRVDDHELFWQPLK